MEKNKTKNFKLTNFESAIDLQVFKKNVVFDKNYKKDEIYNVLDSNPWNYLVINDYFFKLNTQIIILLYYSIDRLDWILE